MRQPFSAAPGVNLEYKALSNGEPIRGIEIDNPSGSWLYVVSEQLYCPPYTIGWATNLSWDQTSVTVKAGNGPAGQVATTQGDDWTLYLNSETVSPSSGVPYQFIQQFTPNVLTAADNISLGPNSTPGLFLTPFVLPVVGKRLRILRVEISHNLDRLGNLTTVVQSRMSVEYIPSVTYRAPSINCNIGGPYPISCEHIYPQGSFDLPMGLGFGFEWLVPVANGPYDGSAFVMVEVDYLVI